MQHIAKHNGELKYFVKVINVFFKFASTILININNFKIITTVFEQVLTTANSRHPRRLQTENRYKIVNS